MEKDDEVKGTGGTGNDYETGVTEVFKSDSVTSTSNGMPTNAEKQEIDDENNRIGQ